MSKDKPDIIAKMRTLISETVNHVGELAIVEGWVHLRRDHGKLIFLSLRDRSGMLQIVVNANAHGRAQSPDEAPGKVERIGRKVKGDARVEMTRTGEDDDAGG